MSSAIRRPPSSVGEESAAVPIAAERVNAAAKSADSNNRGITVPRGRATQWTGRATGGGADPGANRPRDAPLSIPHAPPQSERRGSACWLLRQRRMGGGCETTAPSVLWLGNFPISHLLHHRFAIHAPV